MSDFVELVDRVLVERGWSARQVSIEAFGTPNAIDNMRRGRVPSLERVRTLCEHLGLECYVGRRRVMEEPGLHIERLAAALEAVKADFPKVEEVLSVYDWAALVATIYALVDEQDVHRDQRRIREVIAIARRFGVAEAVHRTP